MSESTLNQLINNAQDALTLLKKENDKFLSGNKAAGTRVRSIAQQIKKDMQEIRNSVTEIKNQKS